MEILKVLGFITNRRVSKNIEEYQEIYNMIEKNITQEFRLKNTGKTRNYSNEEIMPKK